MLKYLGEEVGHVQGAPKRDISDNELAEIQAKDPEVHAAILRSGFWEDDSKKKAATKPPANKTGEQKPPDGEQKPPAS